MARHIEKVTSQKHGSFGEEPGQGTPPEIIEVDQAQTADGLSGISCPVNKCDGRLSAGASGFDARTALESLVCPLCGHRGLRSRDGVVLLFRSGYEFKFSYGPSVQTITIILSSAAVNLWSTHDVMDDHLARVAAEWALLCGHTDKQIHLGLPAAEFADFYLYFCKQKENLLKQPAGRSSRS